ncbi:hypothetical protein ACOSP7_006101 [Xanthoceras sorbifolium]
MDIFCLSHKSAVAVEEESSSDRGQAELGILILVVPFQTLANCNGLLDEVVKILRNFRGPRVLCILLPVTLLICATP